MAQIKTPTQSNHKEVVPMRFDDERIERYRAEADRRGMAVSRVLDEFILKGENQDQLQTILEKARGPNNLDTSKYDQHVFFAALWLEGLNESLAIKLEITDEMRADWAAQPHPILTTKVRSIPSIKAGTKAALKNFVKEIESPSVFLMFITFVLLFRPLSSFDMNPGPVMPGHYDPTKNMAMWGMYATSAISYALLATTFEKHTEKHPVDIAKLLDPSDEILKSEFERFERLKK